MKLILSKQDLISLISKIQNIVPIKPTIPILSHVLIEAVGDEVIFTATDLMIGMRVHSGAKILEEGGITLPARNFFSLCKELPNTHIEISSDGTSGNVEIIAGLSKFKLNGSRHEEFPEIPSLSDKEMVKINTQAFKEALFQTSFAVSKEDSRFGLTGVFVEFSQKSALFVATDGRRLAKTTISIDCKEDLKRSFILPYKTVEELQKYDESEEEITLYLMHDKIAAESSKTLLISKLLAGDYPDFQKVIPKKCDLQIVLHREELISLLRQIILFTADHHSAAKFTFMNGELHISAHTQEMGYSSVSMPVNYTGSELRIAFSPHYFLDILKHSHDETVTLGLIDAQNPGLITDSTEALFVIMPMRLQEA